LLSDTGMRLGEAVGLAVKDINLDNEIPHLNLIPHPWRRLKTKGSERCVPLVGEALWAAFRAIKESLRTLNLKTQRLWISLGYYLAET